MKVSIVIRTYNEQKHLRALLEGIQNQHRDGIEIETVIVDSGSTDNTVKIANEFPTRVVPIKKEEFSFGRSLNIGCAAATGEALVETGDVDMVSFTGSTRAGKRVIPRLAVRPQLLHGRHHQREERREHVLKQVADEEVFDGIDGGGAGDADLQ